VRWNIANLSGNRQWAPASNASLGGGAGEWLAHELAKRAPNQIR